MYNNQLIQNLFFDLQRREETSGCNSSTCNKNHWSLQIPNANLPPILKIVPDGKNQTGI